MADISKISVNNNTYDIKDAFARNAIANMHSFEVHISTQASDTPAGITWYKGETLITGTLIASSSTSNNIYFVTKTSNTGKQYYEEYITVVNGSTYSWEKFGDTETIIDNLGSLAYKNNASGTFTPSGSVSQPTFNGSTSTVTVTGTPSGSIGISTGTGIANYTPSGSVSKPSFTGTAGSVSVSGTPAGSIGTGSGTANYTPSGSVSAPTITVTPNTTSVYSITDVGTAPSWSAGVSNETLSFTWSAGSQPSRESKTVATGIKSATASTPNFTGTGVQLTFSGDSMTSTGTFTPSGSVSQPSFTGTGVELKGSFSGNALTSSGSFTPSGTVTKPTFTGTQGNVTVS